MNNKWHAMPIADVERVLGTDSDSGLSMRKARERLRKEIREQGGKRTYLFAPSRTIFMKRAFAVVFDPCMILLLLTALLAVLFGGSLQGLMTVGVALICCSASVIMSYTSQKRFTFSKEYSSPLVRVIRGGDKYYTDGRNAVAGDVILLRAGDLLPCDARIVESSELVVKELIHMPDGIKNRTLKKDHILRYLKDDTTTAPNASNMLYAGTAILSGTAKAIVTETGRNVYLASFLSDGDLAKTDTKTELEKKLAPIMRMIRWFSVGAFVILSLIALLTSKNTPVIDNLLLILASITLISGEMLGIGINYVYSAYIYKLSAAKKRVSGRKGDLCATVKGVGVMDKLKDLTALAVVGRAGLTRGELTIGDVYTCGSLMDGLAKDTVQGKRLLSLVYTYVKTLKAGRLETDDISGDICNALERHVKTSGFDFKALDIYLRSLYYVNDGTRGYACAETANSQFRVALTHDDSVLDFCSLIRCGDEERDISETDVESAKEFCKNAAAKGAVCLYAISEFEGAATLEGVITLEQIAVEGFEWTLSELENLGISTYMFFDNELDASLIIDLGVSQLYRDRIALASKVSADKAASEYDKFGIFAGYTKEDQLAIIEYMKSNGEKIAVFSVDDANNAIISRADVSVSCDYLKYSSDKHKDSSYADLEQSGSDANVRCSAQTRLFSGVIVKRAHANGGGIAALVNAIKSAKMARLSVLSAITLCLRLMATVLPFVVVSVFSGAEFIGAFMLLAFCAIASMLPFVVYTENDYRAKLLYSSNENTDVQWLVSCLPSAAARALLSTIFAITLAVLGYTGVFGDSPAFSAALSVGLLFTVFAEAIVFDATITKRGEGRSKRWMKIFVAYAAVLCLCGIATQDALAPTLFPNGIGTYEFIIVPLFLALYLALMFILRLVRSKVNKR